MSDAIQSAGDLALTQSVGAALSSRAASANAGASGGNVDKAAQDFEGMFMSQMLQPMFETVKVDPIFGGGHGEEVMRGFLTQEYGKVIAKGGHLGLASYVKDAMIRAQGKAANNRASASAAGKMPTARTLSMSPSALSTLHSMTHGVSQ